MDMANTERIRQLEQLAAKYQGHHHDPPTAAECAAALDVQRRYGVARVRDALEVVWYTTEGRMRAVPRDDKYEGAWLVGGDHWEQYYPREWVLEQVTVAVAVDMGAR